MKEASQIQFSVKAVVFEIEAMAARKQTHLFYSKIIEGEWLTEPGILRKHLLDVVICLQEIYYEVFTISRTPGGLVVDEILSPPQVNGP
jgi:hypothetical protein